MQTIEVAPSERKQSASSDRLSPFTLLATTTLAFSNLLVGLMQNNSFLVLASAIISAAFALVYSINVGLVPWPGKRQTDEDQPRAPETADHFRRKARLPLVLCVASMFVLMPLALIFLEFADMG